MDSSNFKIMHKVITITLSPAVDKNTSVDQLVPEKKLSCLPPDYDPGGGGINVSKGLKKLGTNSLCLFPAGGASGTHLIELMEETGVTCMPTTIHNSTRENFIVVETSTNQQFRFGMPATELHADEVDALLTTFTRHAMGSDYIVASGAIPAGAGTDFFARIASVAKKANARLVVDTSGEALREVLEVGVFLVKPNLGELSKLYGTDTLDSRMVDEAAGELIGNGKCKAVVVSMGPQGAMLITAEEKIQVSAPLVKKMSTVGAGDSMVAGMVHALTLGKSMREVIQMGVACGTAATMNPGTELFKKEDAERLYHTMMRPNKL